MSINISEKRRRKTIEKLGRFFDPEVCESIENGIYDFTEQYCKNENNISDMASCIYRDCCLNIIFNCNKNNSTIQKICKNISKNKFNAYNLAFLRPEELDEDKWKKIIQRNKNTEDRMNNLHTIEWKPCRDCKNKSYFYYQMQTRSADEPMTTFFVCKNCGRTSKVNN